MKKLLTFVIVVFCFTNSFTQIFNEEYGAPIVVLSSYGEWGGPIFILYENGQVIYRIYEDDGEKKFRQMKLSKEETQQLIYSIGITKRVFSLPKHVNKLKCYISHTSTQTLILNFDSIKIMMAKDHIERFHSRCGARRTTPRSFLKIYDKIVKYKDEKASGYKPSKMIEATSYSWDCKNETPIKWPDNWPDLNSEETVKINEDKYLIYPDEKYYNELKSSSCYEINGKKIHVYWNEYFPNIINRDQVPKSKNLYKPY